MEVELYVYDLSRGMARAMSRQFLGIQIDAVYHTSLVFDQVEYLYGAGVQTCSPGTSHHGQPMQVISLGRTSLPLDVIIEYLDSLMAIYTAEAYDLFTHNCNNFTNDFATFLVGKGIPDHITSLPQTVLNTPFGQMLKPQLDASMRTITQAPIMPRSSTRANGHHASLATPPFNARSLGKVHNIVQQAALDTLLRDASRSCAVIFFTSATCGPCRIAYPTYDALAAEYPQSTFIKIDIIQAQHLASTYQIRATPTFVTFLRGNRQDEWTGADPTNLRANVNLLLQQAYPPHFHANVRAPSIARGSLRLILYGKAPPLDKLVAKMGSSSTDPGVTGLRTFIETRTKEGAIEAPLPNLSDLKKLLSSAPQTFDPDVLFTVYDLLRCAMVDPRLTGVLAQDETTLSMLLGHVTNLIESEICPYNLRLVTLQLACNLFSSPLSTKAALASRTKDTATPGLGETLVSISTTTLLSDHDETKPALLAAASSLAFNMAMANYKIRREESREPLVESSQVELVAGLLEALSRAPAVVGRDVASESREWMRTSLLAVGYLVHFSPVGGEVMDACQALDAKSTAQGLAKDSHFGDLARDLSSLFPES